MSEVYVRTIDLNEWISKYFPNKDLITIDDLISVIENLDGEVEDLNNRINDIIADRDENYRRIPVNEQVE